MPDTEPKYVRLKETGYEKNRGAGNKASGEPFQESNIFDSAKKSKSKRKPPSRFQNMVSDAVNTASMYACVMGYDLEMPQKSTHEDKARLKVPQAARSIRHRLFQRIRKKDAVKTEVRFGYMNPGYQSD